MAERRRKGKQAEMECSCWKAKFLESIVAGTQMAEAPTIEAETAEAPKAKAPPQHKKMSAADPVVLSDDDDPIPDPEHDNFNLANQVPREVLLEAREKHNTTRDSSTQTEEE